MLVIFVALRRIFSRLSVSFRSGFRCSVIEFGAMRLSFPLHSFDGIIIVNWLGAVIAQLGRQSGEIQYIAFSKNV